MKQLLNAFRAEILKNKHSNFVWITFVAFLLAPVFGALFMFMMKDNGYEGLSGVMKSKAMMMSVEANWNSMLGILTQAMAIGGIIIYGFVASWLFGREYSDGTAKDLLALPVSRANIINAKFIYYVIWCTALAISNLLVGLLFGYLLNLPGWSIHSFTHHLNIYLISTVLVILLNFPIAFFAMAGRGYLAPLGIVVILVVTAQIFGAMGFGSYFPWAVPGIFAGSGGAELKASLNSVSYTLIAIVGIIGYVSTILWWKYTDQKK